MDLFENLQKAGLLEDTEELFEMAKLLPKHADEDKRGELDVYIYFSGNQGSHGPRVKFYSGNPKPHPTRQDISLLFGINGAKDVHYENWMNKKNSPNAYDTKIINNVKQFVNKTLPILLLVCFRKLDEAEALYYFQGNYTLKELLEFVYEEDNDIKEELLKCKNLKDLHEFCKRSSVYNF